MWVQKGSELSFTLSIWNFISITVKLLRVSKYLPFFIILGLEGIHFYPCHVYSDKEREPMITIHLIQSCLLFGNQMRLHVFCQVTNSTLHRKVCGYVCPTMLWLKNAIHVTARQPYLTKQIFLTFIMHMIMREPICERTFCVMACSPAVE